MKLKFKSFFGSGGKGRSLGDLLVREFNLFVASGEGDELVEEADVL